VYLEKNGKVLFGNIILMGLKPITVNDFRGGLNLSSISDIKDNQLTIAKNVFYNEK
jgi:hypothetical protein